jgi:hypothetical protein
MILLSNAIGGGAKKKIYTFIIVIIIINIDNSPGRWLPWDPTCTIMKSSRPTWGIVSLLQSIYFTPGYIAEKAC